ncbi:hypothetical protein HD806DRAFT_547041 [Xylariaceae sp. AK1471]|nr:hypothetical protein HD806DRAFT_547041 [Xylariaceae sp. AK1471]
MDATRVYLGIWVNHAHGRIMGATLTTTLQQGNFLIAFTGFLISYVASRFWTTLCLVLHQIYSRPHEQCVTIHHQRQITLRNTTSPTDGLVSLLRLAYAWRKSPHEKKRIYLHTLPIAAYAILSTLAFTAAGGLSAQISTSAGAEVLLVGDNCGILNLTSSWDLAGQSYAIRTLDDALNYAQNCYAANSSGILGCDRFVIQRLPAPIADYDADCPFSPEICRGNGTSLRLDTGYIDSSHHLGLNMPDGQPLAHRHVVHCSPLQTAGFTSTSSAKNDFAVRYHYGLGLDQNASIRARSYNGSIISSLSEFMPIPQLARTDGDVSLVFLSGNGILFTERMDDEWYRATVPGSGISSNEDPNSQTAIFKPEEAASPLGCVDQYQWCNTAYPGLDGCGPLGSWYDAAFGATALFNLAEHDLDTRPSSPTSRGTQFTWPFFIMTSVPWGPANIVGTLGAKSLASQTLLLSTTQLPLPKNQWQLDVLNWWNTMLAYMQSSFVNTAVGTTLPNWAPQNADEERLCRNQKIKISNVYTSFNLFGLLFTYITSALIVIASFTAEPILSYLSRRWGYRKYQHLEWTLNDYLHLHRLAQEVIGFGKWSGGAAKVPTTDANDVLANIDVSDLSHPVLVLPRSKNM